jgi:hypothetical protein
VPQYTLLIKEAREGRNRFRGRRREEQQPLMQAKDCVFIYLFQGVGISTEAARQSKIDSCLLDKATTCGPRSETGMMERKMYRETGGRRPGTKHKR